ncbi:MAG: prepilin peptidase [Oceanococcus sp.]
MEMLNLLEQSQFAFVAFSVCVGLLVGSFLNVVISRLPRMMQAEWKQECSALLELEAPKNIGLSLSKPASHCPQCKTPIRAWQNIPIVSWLLLRGRCAQCQTGISPQYPLVELAAGLLAAWAAWHFGSGWQAVMAIALAWALLTLTMIDAQTQLLPDSIVLPLLWLGLLANMYELYVPLEQAVAGAMVGYLSLWTVYWGFKLLTGKEGMGYGDFKLLAALGAWMGWQQLPWVILASSAVGAIFGIGMMLTKRLSQGQAMPFGPYLAIAGWLSFLYGDEFSTWYFGFMT